jgi:flagellar hook-associated protein 2
MASINFSGLGSSIDFNLIRDAIITQRSRPITQMQSKVAAYNNRVEALRQFNGAIASLTSAMEVLTNRDLGSARNATTTDAAVATASAASTANLGSFEISVTRVATNLTQASRSYISTDLPIIAGGATSATFELRKGGAPSSDVQITIDDTTTLAGLRDQINSANAGVTATIVDLDGSGSQQQIVLTSAETGAAGRVELVETTSTGTGTDINLRSLNPPDGDNSKLDAALSINGLSITRSSNTVTDAIAGLTLNLKKVGTTSIGVTQSTDLENKLRGFVTAYNTIQDIIAGQYKKDSSDRPTGILAGDPTLRNVQQQLRTAVGALSSDNGGSFASLADIGITAKDTGHLEYDTAVLNEKLKSDPESVKALLFGLTEAQTGIFQNAHKISKNLSDSVTGVVQNAITGYQASAKNLGNVITRRLEGLNRLQDSLTKQFAIADAAINQLNNQGTALQAVIKSLQPKEN